MNWQVALYAMLPEHLLLTGIVLTIVAGLVADRPRSVPLLSALVVTAAAAAALSLAQAHAFWAPFPGHFSLTPGDALAKAVVLGLAVPVMLLAREEFTDERVYTLLLGSLYGACLLISSDSFLTLFLGLEIMSLPVYVLVLIAFTRTASAEAALKYLVLGGMGSATLLLGASLLFGAQGSLALATFTAALGSNEPLAIAGVVLVLAALFLKAAIVPLHAWAPDAYEGASVPVTAFMATIVKAGALLAAWRLFAAAPVPSPVAGLLVCLPLVSMVWGNLTAMRQDGLRRMLAYSSIAHAGYLFFAFLGDGPGRHQAILFYLLAYGLMNVLAFASVPPGDDATRDRLDHLQGLYQRQPFAAVSLAAAMLSLAGIPPLPGFVAKFLIFRNVLEAGYTTWAVLGLVASYLGIYFYLRVIQAMFMAQPAAGVAESRRPALLAAVLCLLPALFLMVFPGWVLDRF